MNMPKNNLSDVLRRYVYSEKSSDPSISKDPMLSKAPRFKPSKAKESDLTIFNTRTLNSQKATSSSCYGGLPSFSTPGFHKKGSSSKEHSINIDVDTPPYVSNDSSLKRKSPDLINTLPRNDKSSHKKYRSQTSDENKENTFQNVGGAACPQSTRNTIKSHALSKNNEHGFESSKTSSIENFDFRDCESDLEKKSLEELKALLRVNLEARTNAMQAIVDFHCETNRGLRQDLYVLQGYNALLDMRVEAIRKAIDKLERCCNERSKFTTDAPQLLYQDNVLQTPTTCAPNPEPLLSKEAEREVLILPDSDDDLWATFETMSPELHDSRGDPDVLERDMYRTRSDTVGDHSSSPYYTEAIRVLKEVFNLDGFRPNQFEAISATMAGKDVFVLMPTGGGKSLCYQVPAVCHSGNTDGVTVVVSPLIALMIDQVHHLKDKGIDAVLFNSDQGTENSRDTRNRLIGQGRKPRLLYVTPEKLHHSNDMRNILGRLYQSRQLARFVIDEAHCVSTWGRDFRDAYQDLDRLRVDYPTVPIMALTATANEQVIGDIVDRLRIQKCVRLTQSFNRPNLFYEIRPKKRNVLSDISDFIKNGHVKDTGVIYCLSRKKCEEVAKELRDAHGLRARHYHAQMSAADKARTQTAWQAGECEIIVATIAFGMGIDKANVRYVIHHSLPMSLDGYYQETGRAGRDGKPATCIMYYTFGDTNILFKLINEGEKTSVEEKKRQKDGVRVVVQYCANNVDCRRTQLLNYFGQSFNEADCHKSCDNCQQTSDFVEEDMTAMAINVVKLVESMLENCDRFTKNHCMNVFKGSNLKDIKDKGHDKLPLYGIGRKLERDRIERLFDHLELYEVLKQQAFQNQTGWNTLYIQLGPMSDELRIGRMKLVMRFRVNGEKSTKPVSRSTSSNTSTVKKSKQLFKGQLLDDCIDLYQEDIVQFRN